MSQDRCCVFCVSILGVCLSNHGCKHHKDAQKQDELNHRARRSHRDPTGDQAAARADRARKKGRT